MTTRNPHGPRAARALAILSLPLFLTACAEESAESGSTDTARPAPVAQDPIAVPQASPPSQPQAGVTTDTTATEGKLLLMEALANMRKVTSYHAEADIRTTAGNAAIIGDFAPGKGDFTIHRADGLRTRSIVIGREARISSDDGKTWRVDTTGAGPGMAAMISAPISPSLRLADQGPVSMAGTETVDGVPARRVTVMTAQPTDVWIADLPGLGPVPVKIHLMVTSRDGEFFTTTRYSAHNKPLNIRLPQ